MPHTNSDRVVIQCKGKVIKGYLEHMKPGDLGDLLGHTNRRMHDMIQVRMEDGSLHEIQAVDAKAVFFVKTFEGAEERDELKFFSHAPIVHGVWIQVQFQDGEVVEGIVNNSMHHVVEKGFFMTPTDPGSNNKLIYVMKSALKDYRVLGVRAL
jgi:hypothetical protein